MAIMGELAIPRSVLIGCHEWWQIHTKRAITTDLLHRDDTRGDGLVLQIVTGDETWAHRF
jgi:hypothetical protein